MKLLHLLGHNCKWNLDSYFKNEIWDWFILSAYSINEDKIWKSISKHPFNEIMNISMLDLQYYGWKWSTWWQLDTYKFHPIHTNETMLDAIALIIQWIDYQISKWFKNIIIPHAYYNITSSQKIIDIINAVNKNLEKKTWYKYYMTLPISNDALWNKEFLDELLLNLTDQNIKFDWYYIVCEAKPWTRKKINDNFLYYNWLYRVLNILKSQNFELIYAYANFDALIFYSLLDIDFISIWTYENLRNFDIKRFIEEQSWWPSDWWYFSEKLLNMVKANQIDNLRLNKWLDIIRNENNIFSDEVLTDWFIWNTHKPSLHKNYLLSISKLFKKLWDIENLKDRKNSMIEHINTARNRYKDLEERGIYLMDESWDYFLWTWLSFLKSVK